MTCLSISPFAVLRGLWPVALVNSLRQFRVITASSGATSDQISIAITSPSGKKVKAHIIPTAEGCLANFVPNELGQYLLSISIGGIPLTAKPYHLYSMPEVSPASLVRAY